MTLRLCLRPCGTGDVNSLVTVVFSGLSALVVEDVADGGEVVRVTARTSDVSVPCPVVGCRPGGCTGTTAGRWRTCPCPTAGLPGPGLPAADLSRTGPRAAGAPSTPHHTSDQPGLDVGQGDHGAERGVRASRTGPTRPRRVPAAPRPAPCSRRPSWRRRWRVSGDTEGARGGAPARGVVAGAGQAAAHDDEFRVHGQDHRRHALGEGRGEEFDQGRGFGMARAGRGEGVLDRVAVRVRGKLR